MGFGIGVSSPGMGPRSAMETFAAGDEEARAGLQPTGGNAHAGLPASLHENDGAGFRGNAGCLSHDFVGSLSVEDHGGHLHHSG